MTDERTDSTETPVLWTRCRVHTDRPHEQCYVCSTAVDSNTMQWHQLNPDAEAPDWAIYGHWPPGKYR